MNTALANTEKIKTIFLDTQLFYAKHNNMLVLIAYLENIEPEFRSVAYESASMCIALKNLVAGNFPDEWLLFAKGSAAHQAQVYVGLGWAIAKSEHPFLKAVEKLNSQLYFRITDGCGYYDGTFKRRQTVIDQQLPVYLSAAFVPMYYQGVGRSIWYSEKTDIHKIHNRIATFATSHHGNLWRGVGIAVAYVGGCDDEDLKTLFEYADKNGSQLACGAALAARSRTMANTMTQDTNRCCRLWFALTFEKDVDENIYLDWIKKTEEQLSANFITV